MKYTFTPIHLLFKSFLFSLVFLSFSFISNAQQTHNVTVSSFQFSPSTLTINVGDMVVWTNTNGSHNVNGTQGTFPGNPVSFGNNVGSGWTYSFTFTVAGSYNYHCDPHSGAMMGSITVLNPSGITEAAISSLSVYPNPASKSISVSFDQNEFDVMDVFMLDLHNMNGKLVQSTEIIKNMNNSTSVDISALTSGMYIYTLRMQDKKPVHGKLMIQ